MGLEEAHAKGQAIEYNFIKENGGIIFDEKEKRFGINKEKIKFAVEKLAKELNSIEAAGDYQRAKKLTDNYGYLTKELKDAYKSIEDIPVELLPIKTKV